MNGSQLYNLRYYLEQLHYLGYSDDERRRIAEGFLGQCDGDYDKAGEAMTADLQRRQSAKLEAVTA